MKWGKGVKDLRLRAKGTKTGAKFAMGGGNGCEWTRLQDWAVKGARE